MTPSPYASMANKSAFICANQRPRTWKYRVGDYRLICSLENDRLIVLVLRIGHRREVYKR